MALLLGALCTPSTRAQDGAGTTAAIEPPPSPIAPDARREQREAFFQSLGGLSEYSRRHMRLERARRVAGFDLDWGIE